MSARRRGIPIGTSGRATLIEPTQAKPNYRIIWYDEHGRRAGEHSGSRRAQEAWNRAHALDARLSARQDPAARLLGDVEEYVSTRVGRKCDKDGYPLGTDWSPSHHQVVTRDLRRAVREVADVPAYALDRELVDRMRSACGTPGMVRQTTRHVRGFLNWARRQHALTDEQVASLPPHRAPVVEPRFAQPCPRPDRARTAPMIGQSQAYIRPEDCPSPRAVSALADALQRLVSWGTLAVHIAAETGLRIGEQFQLRADDVVANAKGRLIIRADRQWSSAPGRRTVPKTGKRRTVPVRGLAQDGYRLEDALRQRVSAARAEQAAGTNPEGLLFPAPEGGMWWSSNLSALLVSAQKSAGWTFDLITEQRRLRNGETKTVTVTQMHHTWHSLRHRFARTMVDEVRLSKAELMLIGGWDSLQVVETHYYQAGNEHVESAHDAVHERAAVGPATTMRAQLGRSADTPRRTTPSRASRGGAPRHAPRHTKRPSPPSNS